MRRLRGARRRAVMGLAAAALVLVVLMAFNGPNSQPPPATATAQPSCADGVETAIALIQEDAGKCLQQIFGLDPKEGETLRSYFTYTGGWEPRAGPIRSSEEGYSAASIVEGSENFEVLVKTVDGDVVHRSALTRSEFGLLQVDVLNLPGADVLQILDSDGQSYEFEVA